MTQKYFEAGGGSMICVKKRNDINHLYQKQRQLHLIKIGTMFLSKSFGYGLRGILYVALMQDEKRKVQIDEIAEKLSVPRHFLGKIMQQVVKAGLLQSTKGPYGGFALTEKTLDSPLIDLVKITDDMEQFKICALKLKYCNRESPCPLHTEMEQIRTKFLTLFETTTLGDLLTDNKNTIIKSLSAM